MAIFPIYTKIWEHNGEEETIQFLTIIFKYYWVVAIAVVCGVTTWSGELITILASAKYSESNRIVPFIIISVVLFGSYNITNAGFFLKNKTKRLSYYTLIAAGLNIILNLREIKDPGKGKGVVYIQMNIKERLIADGIEPAVELVVILILHL